MDIPRETAEVLAKVEIEGSEQGEEVALELELFGRYPGAPTAFG